MSETANFTLEFELKGRIAMLHKQHTPERKKYQSSGGWKQETFEERKRASREVARRMQRIGEAGRAERMNQCGDTILLAECPKGDHRHLVNGNYCRDRLCPQCMAIKARKDARELAEECMTLERRRGERRPSGWVLITLTTENVPGGKLREEVDRQLKAWSEMARRARFKAASMGWIRRMEITYNKKRRDHHVHIHALAATAPGYFDPASGLYITQRDLQAMWAKELGVDLEQEDLIVDIRAVIDREKVKAEVTKYVTKVLEYLGDDRELKNLAAAIKGKNMMQWGGELRKIRRELGHTERGGADEADEPISECPECGSKLETVFYGWMGLEARYKKLDR